MIPDKTPSDLLDNIASYYADQLNNAWVSFEDKRWELLLEFLNAIESILQKIDKSDSDRKSRVLVESLLKILHLIERSDFFYTSRELTDLLLNSIEQADKTFDDVKRPQTEVNFVIAPGEPIWISAVKKWKQWTKTGHRDADFRIAESHLTDTTMRWTQTIKPLSAAVFELERTLKRELVQPSPFRKNTSNAFKRLNQLVFSIVTSDFFVDEDDILRFDRDEQSQISAILSDSITELNELISTVSEQKDKRISEIGEVCERYQNDLRATYDLVDTVSISLDEIGLDKVKSEIIGLGSKLESADESFFQVKKAFCGHLTLYKELTELQINSLELRDELYTKLNRRFDHLLFSHTDLVVEELEKTREQLKTIRKLDEDDIRTQNEKLNKLIQTELLEPLSDTDSMDRLIEEVDLYKTDIQLFVNERSSQITIPTVWDNSDYPPKIILRDLSWSNALNRIFFEQHLRKVDQMPGRCSEIIQETRTEVASLTESLEVNLLAAVDLLDQSVDEEKEKDTITYESIDRILNQFTELLKEKKHALSSIQLEYKKQIEDVFAYLFSLLKNEKLDDLHQREKELQVKGTAIDWKTKLSARWAQFEDRSLVIFRFILLKGRNLYHLLAPWVGLEPLNTSQSKESKLLGDYLDELDKQFKSLPYIYRKVFDVYNQRDLRFFTGYGSELQMQAKHFEEWQKGSKRAINVLGEIGSGKTTYLDKFISNLPKETRVERLAITATIYEEEDLITFFCRAFDLNPVQKNGSSNKRKVIDNDQEQLEGADGEISTKIDSGLPATEEEEDDAQIIENAEELIQWLNNQSTRVIVLEGLHNLFLRVVDGFGALELFYLILSETAGNVHWVTSINRHSWEYLDKVIGLKQFYSQIVATDKFSVEEIQEVVEKRHSTTGFQIRFEPDAEIAQERAYKKVMDDEEQRQSFLRKRIFQNIMVTAKGNISIALLQWVRSVKSISKLEMVFEVMDDYTIKLPDSLSTDDLFTLAFFVQHGNVKIEEHAFSFRQGVRKSRAQISKLAMQSLILKDEKIDSYSLNPLVYRPVIRTLTSKNILH